MATTSNYPGAIDSFPAPPATLGGTPTHEDLHLQLDDAIEKLETELGVDGRHRTSVSFANAAARDVANASPSAGELAHVVDVDRLQYYNDGAWWDVPLVQAGRYTGVTDAAGDVAITYPQSYPTGSPEPMAVCSVEGTASKHFSGSLSALSNTGFTLRIRDETDAVHASSSIVFNWIATPGLAP